MPQDFLKFLSAENKQRLNAIAKRRTFVPGETILTEGEVPSALFLVLDGNVRVERSHMGFSVEVSRLRPGEIFGEMSFVEKFGASASVVADTEVSVDIFEEHRVQELMTQSPTFAGEFYRSLAQIISRRLRETTVRSISEFSWGGYSEDAGSTPSDWGGGSPFTNE